MGPGNDAALTAPRRDCQIHVDLAQQNGSKIKYILQTHRNEDYVMDSVDRYTGLKIE